MLLLTVKVETFMKNYREFLRTIGSFAGEFRNEDGCVSCQVFRGMDKDSLFCLVAEWETVEKLNNFYRTSRFKFFLKALNKLTKRSKVRASLGLHNTRIEYLTRPAGTLKSGR